VLVQSLQDNIILHGISPEGDGSIRAGDALVLIDNDDCSCWPLSRIRARLNNFRIPVGNTVRLTFERRVPLQQENNDDDGEDGEDGGAVEEDGDNDNDDGDATDTKVGFDIDEVINIDPTDLHHQPQQQQQQQQQQQHLHKSKHAINIAASFELPRRPHLLASHMLVLEDQMSTLSK